MGLDSTLRGEALPPRRSGATLGTFALSAMVAAISASWVAPDGRGSKFKSRAAGFRRRFHFPGFVLMQADSCFGATPKSSRLRKRDP